MLRNLARLVIAGIAALAGYHSVFIVHNWFDAGSHPIRLHYLIVAPVLAGILGWLIAPLIILVLKRGSDYIVTMLQRVPTPDAVAGACGLIVGMLIGALATFSLPRNLPIVGSFLPFLITLFAGYIGSVVAVRRREELMAIFVRAGKSEKKDEANSVPGGRKLLDTSVIIDGRIVDICRSGFIEGALLVPTFVLEELQHIADSSDPLRRNRGRRGLDILAQLQELPNVAVEVISDDFEDVAEVDTKLIRLAQELGVKVLTNDYNLNKVAGLQGVSVLNINELANAVKPVVLPGEEMEVQVIKEGKELGQGVGYLDDGTMIVVDNGKRYMGRTITVVVTSVLQTSAGRMIFGKPKDVEQMVEALQ